METLYGHRICGAFGYSHLTGMEIEFDESQSSMTDSCRRLRWMSSRVGSRSVCRREFVEDKKRPIN